MDRPQTFTKIDLKPKAHHGYAVLLFVLGTLLPPLAVAARFGIGTDFWLNTILTICGYIPGHVHNFYIQNIRNNKNHRRTPKWAIRYGLVDTTEINRKKKKSQWATRFNERLPESTLEGQELEEGQVADDPSRPRERGQQQPNGDAGGDLWTQDDEAFYRSSRDNVSVRSGATGSSGRWRYPANFQDTEPAGGSKKSKKGKKDRWARVDEAMLGDGPSGSSKRKKSKSKKGSKSTASVDAARRSVDSVVEPEDAVGGLYGDRRPTNGQPGAPKTTEEREQELRDVFDHQF